MAEEDVSTFGARTAWAFYFVAFVFPIGGLLLAAMLSGRSDPAVRAIARNALIAALLSTTLACACLLIDLVVIMPRSS